MAINNHNTASSAPLVRTDTPQPTAPLQPGQGPQAPRLYVVKQRTYPSTLSSTSPSPVTVTRPPQRQAVTTPIPPRFQHRDAAVALPSETP